MKDPAELLARHVVYTNYNNIPKAAIERAKLSLLDVIACAIGAAESETTKAIRTLLVHWGGRPESTVIGSDIRLPSPFAAQANATTARVLDLDDTYELAPGGGHASAYVVPTAMAVAEAEGTISGADLLAAIAIGQDIYCRLARSVRANLINTGRDNMFSVFGPAVTAARLLRLDLNCTVNALGISYAEAAGEMQMYEEGAHTVALQQGFRARSGLSAAYLARANLRGPHAVFEGRYGFYRVFEPDHDVNALLDNLGSEFIGAALSFKYYPCSKSVHPALDAILYLREKNNFGFDDLRKLEIGTNKLNHDFVAVPRERKWMPRSGVEGRFSLPYVAAVAVVKGAVGIEHFNDAAINDPQVRRIMEVTEISIDPEIERMAPHTVNAPASVAVHLLNGHVIKHRVDKPKGHPDNPANLTDGAKKLRECLAFSELGNRIDIDRIVQSVADLDRASNLRELLSSLCP